MRAFIKHTRPHGACRGRPSVRRVSIIHCPVYFLFLTAINAVGDSSCHSCSALNETRFISVASARSCYYTFQTFRSVSVHDILIRLSLEPVLQNVTHKRIITLTIVKQPQTAQNSIVQWKVIYIICFVSKSKALPVPSLEGPLCGAHHVSARQQPKLQDHAYRAS